MSQFYRGRTSRAGVCAMVAAIAVFVSTGVAAQDGITGYKSRAPAALKKVQGGSAEGWVRKVLASRR